MSSIYKEAIWERNQKIDPPPKFATGGAWHTHHVILFDDLLNSPAYVALSSTAKEAYTILMQEYKGKFTNNTVKCPYSTFKAKGMRPNTLSHALLQLETYGFISIEHGDRNISRASTNLLTNGKNHTIRNL